jgi:uncharacterized membrane protein (DUF4010 family)
MAFVDTALGGALLALLIGLLLGLERERSQSSGEALFAGIRTFPMLALAGYLGALAAQRGLPLVLPVVLLAVGALAVAAYWRSPAGRSGATTEAAALLTTLLGVFVGLGEPALAGALAVLVALLLTLKGELHKLAGSVTGDEILAILKFGVVSVVLLPLLSTRAMGPYGAIVPRHVGIVVVLVSGVSLVGYLLVRILGARAGWALAGAMGGLVSSTAVTLSFSAKAKQAPAPSLIRALAAGIILATAVLYLRSVALVGLFDRALALYLAPRMAVLAGVGALFGRAQLRGEREPGEALPMGNPVELGRAAVLALLFALILMGSRAAQAELGDQGLRVAGLVGGLVDVDSVALAVTRLKGQGLASQGAAAQAYILATLANLAFKSAVTLVVGGRALASRVLPAFAVLAGLTAAVLLIG